MPRFLKGSDEAKEYMKRLRNMKLEKGKGIQELVTTYSQTGDINASRHKSLAEDIKKLKAKLANTGNVQKANKLQQKIDFATDKKNNLYNIKAREMAWLNYDIDLLDGQKKYFTDSHQPDEVARIEKEIAPLKEKRKKLVDYAIKNYTDEQDQQERLRDRRQRMVFPTSIVP
jgi:polyhydroxyalkanoate synthesis regulator phasin